MTDFTVTITDEASLAGITAARLVYNETAEAPLETDDEYVQFVMEKAALSYAVQYGA